MKGHEEIERILAGYRDASPQERATADAHVEICPQCAAQLAAYSEVDRALADLSEPALPPGLSRPLSSVVAAARRPRRASRQSPTALGFAFPGFGSGLLAPAGLILLVVIALSAVLWSVSSVRIPATSTPTLTTTLTPTTISTETEVVGYHRMPPGIQPAFESGPTPAPAPAPVAQPSAGAHSPMLLAGYSAHATITN